MNRHESDRLRRMLLDAVDVYETLGGQLTGHNTGEPGEGVSGSKADARPLPLQAGVAEHRHALVTGLRWWTVWLRSNTVRTGTPATVGESPAGMAVTLASAPELFAHADAAELLDQLTGWHRRARTLTDLPRLRGQVPVCAHHELQTADELAAWSCAGVVFAMLPADRDQVVTLQCRDCRTGWTVGELPQAAHMLLPVDDAARVAGVHRATVYRWAKLGRVDVDDRGRVTLGDIVDAAA